MTATPTIAYTFDEAVFRSLASTLLPSAKHIQFHRHGGTIAFWFDALDDFIAASIGASSANIVCEVSNSFEGKHAQPRTISSCGMKLALAPGLNDERIIWFFAELALLRRGDGTLPEAAFTPLFARLHAGGNLAMEATR